LGRDETTFFGAPKKEKRGVRRERTPFFAVLKSWAHVELSTRRADPVDHLGLFHVLGQPSLA
jgi:hypothetical protein